MIWFIELCSLYEYTNHIIMIKRCFGKESIDIIASKMPVTKLSEQRAALRIRSPLVLELSMVNSSVY